MDSSVNQHMSWGRRLAHRVKALGSRGHDSYGETDPIRKSESKNHNTLAPPEIKSQNILNELGERLDYQTGILGDSMRVIDSTDMLHSLATTYFDVNTTYPQIHMNENDPTTIALRRRLMIQLTWVSDQIWHHIGSYLDLADRSSLAMACKLTLSKFADDTFAALSLPENKENKLRFLHNLDVTLPFHLLCFHCGVYHVRIQPGNENLRAAFVNHPVFICPLVRTKVLPRTRLAHGRELPYVFVQLALRAARFGLHYGISLDTLGSRWQDPKSGWSHQTRYHIHQGHLLLRVRSQVWARPGLTPSEMRLLLFDRDEYTPYFSVCKHWRDGDLTRVSKCVLSHVPGPPPSAVGKGKNAASAALNRGQIYPSLSARQCNVCMPARRCPECPSEYLLKLIRAEDKQDSTERFKFSLVAIRWCDLGDGSGPAASPEWASIHGLLPGYPSLERIQKRALMGVFEGAITGVPPPNRLLNLNPTKSKKRRGG
ncbi:hypothetical protein GQ53DRAFT_151261 [Thozetella sp. PMI_491]|nr:hypothetical protein GQ53DRAFT_151261 [Thozetella sp. PMI_491]